MKKLALLPALILTLALNGSAEEGRVLLPTEPLLAVDDPAGMSLGLRYGLDRLDLRRGGGRLEADAEHIAVRAGCNFLPFLHTSVEAGHTTVDIPGGNGDGGFSWAVGAHLDLLEQVIRSSPVTGRKEAIRLTANVAYSQYESDLGDVNFEWDEFTAMPQISYVLSRRGESVWYSYVPSAVAMHLGFAFTSIDGDYGRDALSETSTFGLLAGIDFLASSGWVAQLGGIFYDGDDRRVSFGVAYNF